MNRLVVITTAVAALAFGAGKLAAQAPDGAALYTRNCVACHGATGVPNPAMVRSLGAIPDLSDARAMAAKADSSLISAVANGVGRKMPAYGTRLTGEQIRAIVTQVRTLSRRPSP